MWKSGKNTKCQKILTFAQISNKKTFYIPLLNKLFICFDNLFISLNNLSSNISFFKWTNEYPLKSSIKIT